MRDYDAVIRCRCSSEFKKRVFEAVKRYGYELPDQPAGVMRGGGLSKFVRDAIELYIAKLERDGRRVEIVIPPGGGPPTTPEPGDEFLKQLHLQEDKARAARRKGRSSETLTSYVDIRE